MTINMTDDQLIDYCETHCKTERALFSAEQINRMIYVSGLWFIPGIYGSCVRGAPERERVTGWHSMHEEMQMLVDAARNSLCVAREIEKLRECIRWVPVATLPDADHTVQLFDASANEPVWPGYFDGDKWRYVDGVPATPSHYAPMLTGPVL